MRRSGHVSFLYFSRVLGVQSVFFVLFVPQDSPKSAKASSKNSNVNAGKDPATENSDEVKGDF